MAKLRIAGVGRDYGRVTAVDDFSIDIAAGEFVSLLGPSGCGKTTMLRMIAGFIPPTRGTIELNGRIISSPANVLPPEQRTMSMIFQSYAIWPNMTVHQNVAFGLELRRLSTSEIKKRVGQMLETVRLSDQASRYPAELSGGQQQRVALARAIVVQPEVLLLDEPLSNLDANLRDEMRLEIRRMHNAFKITTVYVTHDQAEAMVTSDRIVVMSEGRIEQIDSPRRIYQAPASRFVASFIGRTNFLTGRRTGAALDFDAFTVPAERVATAPTEDASFIVSIRPHSIRVLAGGSATPADKIVVAGQISDRAYFGDRWDYTVRLSERLTVVVSVEPFQEHQQGEAISLEIDPAQMAVIAGAGSRN